MPPRNLLAMWAGVLLATSVGGADPDDPTRLLAEVTEKHRAALDSIRTVSFAYERHELKNLSLHYEPSAKHPITTSFGNTLFETGPGRYRQTPDRWRITTCWSDGSLLDQVCRHDRLLSRRTIRQDQVPAVSLAVERQVWTDPSGLDRYFSLLFRHTGRDGDQLLHFHHLLEQPHALRGVTRMPPAADGEPGDIRVELSHDEGRYEFWFSPKHNHLIRKVVEYPPAQPRHRHEKEVSAFDETAPGQFFPTRIEYRVFDLGELRQHHRLTLSELQVNRPIPDKTFRIPNIAGMECVDSTRFVKYRVDADGFRVGESTRLEPEPIPPRAELPRTEPADGPTPWWVWAVVASLTLYLIAAGMEIRRLRGMIASATPPSR